LVKAGPQPIQEAGYGVNGDVLSFRLGLKLEPQAKPEAAYTTSAPCSQGTVAKAYVRSQQAIVILDVKLET
jgi:hypothetical protein